MLFFFQAEDGIRDTSVTGVQTCALPISDQGDDAGERDGDENEVGPTQLQGQAPDRPSGNPRSEDGGGQGQPEQIGRASCRERVTVSGGVAYPKQTSYTDQATPPTCRCRP